MKPGPLRNREKVVNEFDEFEIDDRVMKSGGENDTCPSDSYIYVGSLIREPFRRGTQGKEEN